MKILRGSQNYGLAIETSDKDYIQFYYPTVGGLLTPSIHTQHVGNVRYEDIRNLPNLLMQANVDTLQLLYAKEVEGGKDIIAYFREHEEAISRMNLKSFYKSNMGLIERERKKGNMNGKQVAMCRFILKTIKGFAEQGYTNLRSLFEHNEQDVYQAIRKQLKPEYMDEINTLYEECLDLEQDYFSQDIDFFTYNDLERFIGRSMLAKIQEKVRKAEEVEEQAVKAGCLSRSEIQQILSEDEEGYYDYVDYTIKSYLLKQGYARNPRQRFDCFISEVPLALRKQWKTAEDIIPSLLKDLEEAGYYVPTYDNDRPDLNEKGYTHSYDVNGYIYKG